MSTRSLERQIEKLEQLGHAIAEAQSKYSEDCICFPDAFEEQPRFCYHIMEVVAWRLKCPLHGNRFQLFFRRLYLPDWRREALDEQRKTLSPQYQKAWAAGFPPHLWPAVPEKTEDGLYLCLKDGTRLLAWKREDKKDASAAATSSRGPKAPHKSWNYLKLLNRKSRCPSSGLHRGSVDGANIGAER